MNELCHYGIVGMRWGIRRYQNSDGSLTDEGRERYHFSKEALKVKKSLNNSPTELKDQPVDKKTVKARGKLSDAEAEECIALSSEMYKRASDIEPQLTKDVVDAVSSSGSKMYGLEHRLKTVTSLAAKIGADSKADGVDFRTAASGIKDVVRYTSVCDSEKFTETYNSIKSELIDKGYTESKCKNYYDKYRKGEVQHKAVQCNYKNKDGFEFEIQFQTPESQAAKELKIPLYEEARRTGVNKRRKQELENEMHNLAEMVPNPPGVFEIITHNGDKVKHSVFEDSSRLIHYGILGQKWGVRNGPPYPLKGGDFSPSERRAKLKKHIGSNSVYNKRHFDKTIRTEDTLTTLSYDPNRTKDTEMFYATYKNLDKHEYNALFNKKVPQDILDENGNKIGTGEFLKYRIDNKLKTNIKVASEDSASDTFRNLYKNNRDFYNFVTDKNRMENYFDKSKLKFKGYREAKKVLDEMKKPGYIPTSEDLQKVYRIFNYIIPNDGRGSERAAKDVATQRAKFFNDLKKRGYGAVLDTNDAMYGAFKASAPVIVFDMEQVIPYKIKRTSTTSKVFSSAALVGKKIIGA